MADYKITFKRDDCIGCGACVNTCPDNWEMEAGGDKAEPKTLEIDEKEYACNKEAEDVCPVDAIIVDEIK